MDDRTLLDTRAARVQAPVEAVWAEIQPIQRLLAHIPQSIELTPAADGSATLRTEVVAGLLRRTVTGRAYLVDVSAPDRLVFAIESPANRLHIVGRFELTVASYAETNLYFTNEGTFGAFGRVTRVAMADRIEAYARGVLDGVSASAERHWQARQRLENRTRASEL